MFIFKFIQRCCNAITNCCSRRRTAPFVIAPVAIGGWASSASSTSSSSSASISSSSPSSMSTLSKETLYLSTSPQTQNCSEQSPVPPPPKWGKLAKDFLHSSNNSNDANSDNIEFDTATPRDASSSGSLTYLRKLDKVGINKHPLYKKQQPVTNFLQVPTHSAVAKLMGGGHSSSPICDTNVSSEASNDVTINLSPGLINTETANTTVMQPSTEVQAITMTSASSSAATFSAR